MHYTTDIKGSLLPYYITHHYHTDGHIQYIISTYQMQGGCNKLNVFVKMYGTYHTQNIYFQKEAIMCFLH